MKIDTTIDGKTISITLTEDQLKEIERQRNPYKKPSDINNYEDACKVLGIMPPTYDHNLKPIDRIQLIIKAANFLDNDGKVWREDWDNPSQYKYYPVFDRRAGGWVVHCDCCYCLALGGFVPYFKEKETCLFITNKFLDLWLEYMHEGEVI